MDHQTRTEAAVRSETIGIVLDLENLCREDRRAGNWSGAAKHLGELVYRYSARGRVLFCVAVCDRRLARDLGPKLERFGVITLRHDGGTNEADRMLLGLLRMLTDRCSTVVIGSGDYVFAEEARRLRTTGRRVEAVARARAISSTLYASVDDFHEFPMAREAEV